MLGLLGDAIGLGPSFIIGAIAAALAWLWVWWRPRRAQKAVIAYGGSGES